jgi:predicted aspartyl protease
METQTMAKVVVKAKIQNLDDLFDVRNGGLSADKVRTVEVEDALVDTGATSLSMPKRLIDQLGLQPYKTRRAKTATDIVESRIYDAVRLFLRDRDCVTDVTEVADCCPVLIGQLALEALDLVVDPKNRCVTFNPEHGDEHILELY